MDRFLRILGKFNIANEAIFSEVVIQSCHETCTGLETSICLENDLNLTFFCLFLSFSNSPAVESLNFFGAILFHFAFTIVKFSVIENVIFLGIRRTSVARGGLLICIESAAAPTQCSLIIPIIAHAFLLLLFVSKIAHS